jgi:hypothetical protein
VFVKPPSSARYTFLERARSVIPHWTNLMETTFQLLFVVTCYSDSRRVLDWWLDLLTTYRSQIQITIALALISTLYKSLQHMLIFQSLFTSRFPVTDLNNGDSSAASTKFSLRRLLYNWQLISLGYNMSARTAYITRFVVVLRAIPWEYVCSRRRYPITAPYTYLVSVVL